MTGRSLGRGLARKLRGLRAQIVLWTVLPLTLVLIGVAFTGVYSHEQAMRELVQERDRALAVASAGQVRDLIQARLSALAGLTTGERPTDTGNEESPAATLPRGNSAELFPDGVALLDENGSPLATGATRLPWLRNGNLVADLAHTVITHQAVAISAVPGDGLLLLAVPGRDEAGASPRLLVGAVALDSLGLEALLSRAQVGEHGVVYLVDDGGSILAHSGSVHARDSLAGHTGLDTALSDEAAGVTLCTAPDGERMTLAYAPVALQTGSSQAPGSPGWRVIVEQPWHEVIGPVLRYSQFMPLVAALAAVVSVLTLYYGVRAIARPLQALGEQAERVAWGDFDATDTPVGGVAEIEDLRCTLDQMAHRIQNYQRGMHDYIAAMTQGQEEERKRLARELHDDTAQALIALNQQVEMAQKQLETDPGQAAGRLAQVRRMLTETLEGVRRFSRDLRPIYLEDLGFLPALEMLAAEARQGEGLSVRLDVSGSPRRLPPDEELAAYRIVQEALNNVVQHAQASEARVEVRFEAKRLVLSVRDNGRGFEAPHLPDALARQGHFGLMGIQERALLYGGQMALHSNPGEGSQVTVSLPYPTEPS